MALAFVVGALNAAIDPYLLFDAPRLPGINARKPAALTHERKMKAADAVRRPVRTVILGSSRTDIGFNPLSKGWRPDDHPVYNLSLAGAGSDNAAHYLQHLMASRGVNDPPRVLMIGLDFESFLFRAVPAISKAQEAVEPPPTSLKVLPDGRENPHRWEQLVKDYGIAVLSLDALLDSLATVYSSARGTGANIDGQGRMEETAFREAVAANGVAALFLQKNAETTRQYGQSRLVLSETANGPIRDISAVSRLIKIGRSIDAEVVFFIQPGHADRLELLDRMGYWEEFERWKREIAAMVDAQKKEGAKVGLWDFAGYEPYMQERPAAMGDRNTRLTWFWEPAHYTSALGDIMIARMRGAQSPGGYGARITPENVGERLAQIRSDRDLYRSRNPLEVKRITSILCSASPCDTQSR